LEISEFITFRKKLKKTQLQIAKLLGVSVKAIHSYEQGWRSIPAHIERHMFFLLSRINGKGKIRKNCWEILKCPAKKKERCPAWEFQTGELCWFINGTICNGIEHDKWADKINICKSCKVFKKHIYGR